MASLRTRRPRLTADAFIAAAEGPPSPQATPAAIDPPTTGAAASRLEHRRDDSSRRGEAKPWENPGVRPDVIKTFNLRLPEPLKLKLDFIRAHTRVSVHEFVMAALIPAVDREIERLERKP